MDCRTCPWQHESVHGPVYTTVRLQQMKLQNSALQNPLGDAINIQFTNTLSADREKFAKKSHLLLENYDLL